MKDFFFPSRFSIFPFPGLVDKTQQAVVMMHKATYAFHIVHKCIFMQRRRLVLAKQNMT